MEISKVKTAFKIADVEFVEGSTKLNFNYLKNLRDENGNSLPQSILTQNVAKGLFDSRQWRGLVEVNPMVVLKILYLFTVMVGQRESEYKKFWHMVFFIPYNSKWGKNRILYDLSRKF